MKAHTQTFKDNLTTLGKEIDAKVTYTIDGVETELDGDTLGSVTPHYEGNILKSVMKQVDIISDIDIPLNTEINVQFGMRYDTETYEYIDYGNYIVFSSQKQEDTNNYKIISYDKMLYAMKDYEELEITYPITIRDYISAICTKIGLEFANANDTFANYDKEITQDLYKDLGYTYRDILDELAQVTASTICINEDDELEIRYINKAVRTLPNGYTQLDYIQSVGTNVIKTGVIPTSNTDIEVDISNISFNNQFGSPFGYRTAGTNQIWCYIDPSNNNKFQARWGNTSYSTNFVYSNNARIKIRQNKNGLYINDVLQTSAFTTTTISANKDINIFSTNNDGTNQWNITAKLYSARIWENDVLIRDFIPCYRNSDNVVGLYDLINNIFYSHSGTGAFVGGNIISDTFGEDYIKNVRASFGEKYGPINSIVLSRSADSDIVYLQDQESVTQNGLCEIKIKDNQIMNDNTRDRFLPDILEQLDGLEYYINDFESIGITYLDLCDKYNVKIGDNIYPCVMLNDEVNIHDGLNEIIYTEKPKEEVTDYKKASTTDKQARQTYLLVDKQAQRIDALISDEDENFSRIQVEIDNISSQVQSTNVELDSLGEEIEVVRSSITEQTSEAITDWFNTALKPTIEDLENSVDSNDQTLNEIKSYVRRGVITDAQSPYYNQAFVELGDTTNQTTLRILPNRIQFLTNGQETAFISNNQLYINESTILTKEKIGNWVTTQDENGLLNTYWED